MRRCPIGSPSGWSVTPSGFFRLRSPEMIWSQRTPSCVPVKVAPIPRFQSNVGQPMNVVSATVLAEATVYHAFFLGFVPVPEINVAAAYVKSHTGSHAGKADLVAG